MEQNQIQRQRRVRYQSTPGSPDYFIVRVLAERIDALFAGLSVPRQGATCIDVGCGRQPFREALAALGYAYRSIDLVQNPEGTVDYLGAIDAQLPADCLTAGPFDLVFCTEVLEHVFNWDAAFANLFALTRPGGRALLTCPLFYPLHEEPYDQWRATHYTVRRHAEKAGFAVEHHEAAGTGWDVLGTALSAVGSSADQPKLSGKLLRLLFRASKAMLLRAADSAFVRDRLPLASKFYMSNVFLLRRDT